MRGKVRDLLSTLTLSKAKNHLNTCNGFTENHHVSNKGLQWRGSTGPRGTGNGSVLAAGSGNLCETDTLTEMAFSGGDKLEGSNSIKDDAVHLKRRLGLFSGVALIVGTMIGSGIFVSPSGLLIRTGSVGMSFVIWIACGLLSLLGALAYAELGTMNTSSGAEYAYFMDAFGPMPAFLFSWASTLVLKPSQMAIICLSFAKYAVEAFVAECDPPDAAVKAVSVLAIVIILFINCYSVNLATGVQNVFTAAKLIAILIVIVGGLYKLIQGNTQHLENVFHGSTFSFGNIAIAFYTGLWAYDGWNNLNYVTEEIKNPSRNLPMSIIIAIPLVTACYVLINISYLAVMSAAEMVESEAVAVTFGNRILGVMAWLIPLSVTVSTFGSANGTLFAAGRLCFAASREGHLMDILSYVHIRRFTPAPGLIFHSLIAVAMVLSGTIDSLIDFFSFTAWIFYGGAMLALIVMRYTKPDHPRPYKVPIIIPVVVLVISLYLVVAPILDVPQIEYLYAAFFIIGGLVFYVPFVYYGVHCRIMDKLTVFCQLLLEVAPTQTMGAVYKSICNEADGLQLLITRLVEKEIKLKLDIEKLMNEGFVSIAKARYIMGSTCVTKMQLPTENSNPIKPLVTVSREEINNSWIFYIIRMNGGSKNNEFVGEITECLEYSESDFLRTSNSKTSNNSVEKSEEAFKYLLQTNPKSFKKSKNAFLVEDNLYQSYNDDLLDEMSNSSSNESLVSVTDPIRLFGILVPRALKQAQIIFNDAVNLLGDCATVQFELREALYKFNHLIRVKNLIEAASRKSKVDFLRPKVYWTPSETSSVSYYSDESEDEGEESNISVKKSIISVFYSAKDIEPQEEAELPVWGSVDNVNESDD